MCTCEVERSPAPDFVDVYGDIADHQEEVSHGSQCQDKRQRPARPDGGTMGKREGLDYGVVCHCKNLF